MRTAIHSVVLLIVLAFIFLNAQAQQIRVITIHPDEQPPPEGTDTTRVLYATYIDGRIDSIVQIRWDQMYRLWFKEIATEWTTPIGQPSTTTLLVGISDVVRRALSIDKLLPGRILVLNGPTQLTLSPSQLLEIEISGRETSLEVRSTFNGQEFVEEFRREKVYFPDGKLKEVAEIAQYKQPTRRVYERVFDSVGSSETVLISELNDGVLTVIDSEVYVYRNGAIEQATIGFGEDRQDVSHVRMYFSGWHWHDTVIRNGRFTGLDYGGNGYDTIRRQKWVDGAWVSDGVTMHEYKDPSGQLSYTFESHREGAQGVVAWGEDSIWYYPNGDLHRHDHYEFNISLEKPYWTAEYDNTYLNDGRLAASTYLYSGSRGRTDYLHYSDRASVKQHSIQHPLRVSMLSGNRLLVEIQTPGSAQVFDLLGRFVVAKDVSPSDNIIPMDGLPSGVYTVLCDERATKVLKQ